MASKATVLVVEDNELNMKMAKDLLDLAGFETLQAEDADSGIRLARDRKPDLVLMDMHMPICDGYEATRIIKADPETQDIPIVAFTALAMEDEQKKAIQSGCSGVICKPIDVDMFAQTVESYLLSKEPNAHTTEPTTHALMAQPSPFIPKERTQKPVQTPPPSDDSPKLNTVDDVEGFITRLSHDLQSPLRKIRQFSGFLKESAKTELSADNYLMLEALDRSANQMYELLSDLLQLFRIGPIEDSLSEFSLLSVARESVKANQVAIDALHAEVVLGDMSPTIEGQYQQLVQLINQLVQNALKYHAKTGKPRISIQARPIAADRCVEITVQDNGLGFKKEYAELIFQPLQRLHGGAKFSGTGIGLAMVKKIVDQHHGTIQVDSEPDQGSTFTIRLPLKQNPVTAVTKLS